jgi:hypothetical protein
MPSTPEQRQYIEGVTNTPRNLLVDTSLGADTFYRYDPFVAGKLDTVIANFSTILGYTDGIEGAIGSTNSALATISGYTDGIETLIGTTNSSLTGINGKLPTLTALSRLPAEVTAPTYGNPSLTVAASVAVGSSTGTFISTEQFKVFRLQVNNTGANALSAFEISTRCHASADMQVHLNAASHFTAPTANSIIRLSADLAGAAIDLTTLPASGKAIITFDFTNFFSETIRIRAASTSGTTLVFYWGGVSC